MRAKVRGSKWDGVFCLTQTPEQLQVSISYGISASSPTEEECAWRELLSFEVADNFKYNVSIVRSATWQFAAFCDVIGRGALKR